MYLAGKDFYNAGEIAYYRKALAASNGHNPPSAFARPLARRKVASDRLQGVAGSPLGGLAARAGARL